MGAVVKARAVAIAGAFTRWVITFRIAYAFGGMLHCIAAVAFLSPFWVGVVAGIGGTLGELTGYLVGYCSQHTTVGISRFL